MQYQGRKDTLEIFNDTWRVNHKGNVPSERKINNKNDMSFKVNRPNNTITPQNNNINRPMGYNNNRKSGFNG